LKKIIIFYKIIKNIEKLIYCTVIKNINRNIVTNEKIPISLC
jgi:hypothetical protein